MKRHAVFGFLLLCLGCSTHADPGPGSPSLVITHVNVVDVESGRVLPEHTVVIADGHIQAVGPSAQVPVPSGAGVVEARGRYLIPGLWDMHVHLSSATEAALPALVAHGVTAVRDMGTHDVSWLLNLRQEVATGSRIGPRIVAAGPMLDGPTPDWPYRWTVADETEARQAVDSLAALGVDFVKVHQRLPREAYFAVAEQAALRDLPLAGHVPAPRVTASEAIKAGQRSFEHMIGLPMAGAEDAPAMLARLRAAEAWVTPTLVTGQAAVWLSREGTGALDSIPDVPQQLRRSWVEQLSVWPPNLTTEDHQEHLDRALAQAEALDAAAVPFLAGTDLGFVSLLPGSSLHDELELLVRAGLTPAEALQAATVNPARWLGEADSLGTVEPGKVADLVLLGANPLADILNTRKISAVILSGRLYDQQKLDELRKLPKAP